jgi:hypothetical protein
MSRSAFDVPWTPDPGKCRARVYHRDTYRYTGRGESGFELHYKTKQCKRKARESGYCWQHEPEATPCK